MNKKKLNIIITFMTLAVVALLSVQIFWITRSVEIQREQFDQNVKAAMSGITEALEKNEAATVIVKKFTDGDDVCVVSDTITTDSSGMFFISDDETTHLEKLHFIDSNDPLKILNKKPTIQRRSETVRAEVSEYIMIADLEYLDTSKTTKTWHIKSLNDSLRFKRKEIVNELVEELLIQTTGISIDERLDWDNLNRLIREELDKKGLDLDYQFGVLNSETDSLIFHDDFILENELLQSPYKAQLFPGEYFSKPNFLLLNFPEQEIFFIESIQSLLFISIGLLLLIVGIFYQTAQALIKQKKVTEIKNDLINNITHEFKTPLSTISLTCEALKEPEIAGNKKTVERYSNIISTEQKRLQEMVETLLKTALFEKDKLNLELESVDFNDLLKGEANKYELTLERLNGRVSFNFCKEDCSVSVDKFHMGNVISNLIDNAIKYCERDPEITISTFCDDSNFAFSIADNGIGISKNDIDKIFDTFYRVPTGNIQNVKGFGIGLSYIKKIVDAHKGKISVQSKVEIGTTIKIAIPRKGKNNG